MKTVHDRSSTLFAPQPADLVIHPPHTRPQLIVIIDGEEEFDWQTLSSAATDVRSMRCQEPAQRLLNRHDIVPTYVIDYPVASQEDGYRPLLDFLADGRCEVGTQLHPWVNPPLEERVCQANSFAGNLCTYLEREKLRRLTDVITDNLGVRPVVYKAGRYGLGTHTAAIVGELGYQIDSSVMPCTDYSAQCGPNYLTCPSVPYWIGPERRLLEIPTTVGITGLLSGLNPACYGGLFGTLGHRLRVPGMLARLRLLERIRLTPEGILIADAIRLTRALVDRGLRLFVVSYHSPSLVPGCTPYVQTRQDLALFLDWLERYFDFFFGELEGEPTTPCHLREQALQLRQPLHA
ncbi:MAG: glycosyltransferase [Rhodospirillaceae bacterium]